MLGAAGATGAGAGGVTDSGIFSESRPHAAMARQQRNRNLIVTVCQFSSSSTSKVR
jgi:hypothetical protein